jgi:hypothetical protein
MSAASPAPGTDEQVDCPTDPEITAQRPNRLTGVVGLELPTQNRKHRYVPSTGRLKSSRAATYMKLRQDLVRFKGTHHIDSPLVIGLF